MIISYHAINHTVDTHIKEAGKPWIGVCRCGWRCASNNTNVLLAASEHMGEYYSGKNSLGLPVYDDTYILLHNDIPEWVQRDR